jgi:RNA polymerase sigma factor for flagellar operon FliA
MATVADVDERELWAACRDGSRQARNTLWERYAWLAVHAGRAASGFLPPWVEVDDLISTAHLGLVAAIQRFDADRGVPFTAYARQRVRGEILWSLRAWDWRPHQVWNDVLTLRRATDDLTELLARTPIKAEVASYLGVSAAW